MGHYSAMRKTNCSVHSVGGGKQRSQPQRRRQCLESLTANLKASKAGGIGALGDTVRYEELRGLLRSQQGCRSPSK